MGLIVRRAHALSDWGIALSAGGVLGEAELRLEQALALVRDAGDVAGQIPPLYSLGSVLLARSDFQGADAMAAEAARLSERLGNSHLLSRALMERARVAVSTGDRQAAHDLLAESRACDGDVHADLRSPLLACQAALALLDGHPVDALELAAEAVELARAVDDRLDCVVAVLYRSLAEEELGQTTEAEAGFREVIEIEREMGAAPGRAWDARAGLVRVLHHRGQTNAALEVAQPIVTHLMAQDAGRVEHGLGSCEQPLRVHLSVARALMAVGDDRADAVVEVASTLLTGWAASFDEPHRRQQLLQIPYHHEIVQMSQA
jgi:tetratricopeptide (TPR) repeat protein